MLQPAFEMLRSRLLRAMLVTYTQMMPMVSAVVLTGVVGELSMLWSTQMFERSSRDSLSLPNWDLLERLQSGGKDKRDSKIFQASVSFFSWLYSLSSKKDSLPAFHTSASIGRYRSLGFYLEGQLQAGELGNYLLNNYMHR